jgi:CRP/FNR family transcriptional regulator, dissimilatory nitrate respiration regulator
VPLDASTFKLAVLENTLRSCQLFAGLPAPDIRAVSSFVVLKHLDRGDYLFREGDRASGFYIVQKGAINVHRVSDAGKEQVIHVFRPVESFAEATLASDGGYPADARAIEPSTVLLVPKADFIELLRKVPGLALRMFGAMSQHLRVLVGLLDDLTLKDMETRLASWLMKRCPRPVTARPVTVQLDRTKRVLASEMGTTSETLSRTLAKFRDQKLLRVTGNSITILQPLELEKTLRRHIEQR